MPWIAIINMEQDRGPRPVVVMDEELSEPQTFPDVTAIELIRNKSALRLFDWFAFNFVTGESIEI